MRAWRAPSRISSAADFTAVNLRWDCCILWRRFEIPHFPRAKTGRDFKQTSSPAMKTDLLATSNPALAGSLRVLTGSTYSGKRAIYISGTPDGLRLLADLLNRQADSAPNDFVKLEREAGHLFFTTDDSVDVFEMHTGTPEKHPPGPV
jgi:hypothetical protein